MTTASEAPSASTTGTAPPARPVAARASGSATDSAPSAWTAAARPWTSTTDTAPSARAVAARASASTTGTDAAARAVAARLCASTTGSAAAVRTACRIVVLPGVNDLCYVRRARFDDRRSMSLSAGAGNHDAHQGPDRFHRRRHRRCLLGHHPWHPSIANMRKELLTGAAGPGARQVQNCPFLSYPRRVHAAPARHARRARRLLSRSTGGGRPAPGMELRGEVRRTTVRQPRRPPHRGDPVQPRQLHGRLASAAAIRPSSRDLERAGTRWRKHSSIRR
ncbi:unnamed protein product [Phaeothamnion confervicola]